MNSSDSGVPGVTLPDLAIRAIDISLSASWFARVMRTHHCTMCASSACCCRSVAALPQSGSLAEIPILRSQSEEVQRSIAGQQTLCRAHQRQEYDLAYADRTLREQTEERTLLLDHQKHRIAQFRDILHGLKVFTGNHFVDASTVSGLLMCL